MQTVDEKDDWKKHGPIVKMVDKKKMNVLVSKKRVKEIELD